MTCQPVQLHQQHQHQRPAQLADGLRKGAHESIPFDLLTVPVRQGCAITCQPVEQCQQHQQPAHHADELRKGAH